MSSGSKIRGIGKLRHLVVFQKRLEVPDEVDGAKLITSYIDVLTTRCDIESLTDRDYYQVRNIEEKSTHKITVRYREEIKHSGLVGFALINDVKYQINGSHKLEERNRFIQFVVTELGEESEYITN